MDLVTKEEINRLDPTGWKQKLFARDNKDSVKPGDIVQVRQKDSEPFAGVIINIRRRGVDTAFLLRNTVTRIGVEMWFKLYNPIVESVELVQRKQPKRARRAKLYYMRKPKHDVGNVQSIVNQYTRERSRLRGREQS
ncbi:hypothetical protein BJ508DRAFT_302100 [Ascobolus immersus RN42]|uniref:Ribosomal protein L19 n=1 Tax=Ascobolus immersus RN42 TaxID=1160509 RepID=A0A3N4IJ69_ASCIM|nr:hypothetical protein BJ508DRAFT_302100 [Ascobolus immersus RN42]